MEDRLPLEEAIRHLDEATAALASQDGIPDFVFEHLCKASSILEIMFYDLGNEENGYSQPELDFD